MQDLTPNLVVRQTAAGNEFYHTDALGSTLALSNAAGVSTVSYAYEAFGKTTISDTSANPFQYTGRENDGVGLYYYRARYYNPALERFVSEDPLRLSAVYGSVSWGVEPYVPVPRTAINEDLSEYDEGSNFYEYVAGNSLSFNDPYGLKRKGGKCPKFVVENLKKVKKFVCENFSCDDPNLTCYEMGQRLLKGTGCLLTRVALARCYGDNEPGHKEQIWNTVRAIGKCASRIARECACSNPFKE